MALFRNLPQSTIRRDYIHENTRAGFYWMRIDQVKLGKLYPDGRDTRTRLGAEFVVINKTVIAQLPCTEAPPFHMVGDEVCHYIKVTDNEYAGANFAQFLTGMLGLKDAADLERPDIKRLTGNLDWEDFVGNEDPRLGVVQPFRGLVVEMNDRRVLGKKDKDTDPDKWFVNLWYKREVPPAEVLKGLGGSGSELVKRFFPDGYLEKQIPVGGK